MWNMKKRQDPTAPAETIVARAKKRLLKSAPIGADNHWVLPGLEEFGDAYSEYQLYTNGQGTWYCSCYGHHYGEARKEKVCSHAVACALHANLPCQRTLPFKEKPKPMEPKWRTPEKPCDIPGVPEKYQVWRPYQRESTEWILEQLQAK